MGSRLAVRNGACMLMTVVMKWRKRMGVAASTCACVAAATVGTAGLATVTTAGRRS